MKIKILETVPNRWFKPTAWLIMAVQKTNFDHYALEINGSVIDATKKDVRIQSMDDFNKIYKTTNVYEIDIEADFEKEIFPWMVSVCGKGYGFMQILGLAFMKFGITKHNPWGSDKKRIICNELVLIFLEHFAGVVLEKDIDTYDLNRTKTVIEKTLMSEKPFNFNEFRKIQ